MSKAKLILADVAATPACLNALEEAGQPIHEILHRHRQGDWGDVSPNDAALNNAALVDGSRILSAYHLRTGIKIWILSDVLMKQAIGQQR